MTYHRLGGLNDRNSFPHSSGGWCSEVMGLAGLVTYETSLIGLHMTVLSLCLHMVFPLSMSVC